MRIHGRGVRKLDSLSLDGAGGMASIKERDPDERNLLQRLGDSWVA